MKNETWKAVVDYEGLYEVSDLGNVRSLDREVASSDGRVIKLKGRILKQFINSNGRPQVVLYTREKRKNRTVHSLVAEAFIGERPKGYHVLHSDGDCLNNKLSNLSYDTQSENMNDMYRYGSKNPRGKLSIEQVLEIRKLYATGKYNQYELAEKYNVRQNNISRIVNRKSFSYINDDGTIEESKTEVS